MAKAEKIMIRKEDWGYAIFQNGQQIAADRRGLMPRECFEPKLSVEEYNQLKETGVVEIERE